MNTNGNGHGGSGGGAVRHLVALSGGKDSTAMALRLREVEPGTDFLYVCTPTANEVPEMYAHWRRLGEMLGKPILPVTGGRGFKAVCALHRALPSWRMRFCTRDLKIAPFKAFLFANAPAVAYVGLRADEETREGAIYGDVEGITQRHPLREWGWGLRQVREYLEQRGVEIPERTDCALCFFQRLPEWWQLWQRHPDLYAEGEALEAQYGHTFRSERRDSYPANLCEMRQRFEAGDVPRGAAQLRLFADERDDLCQICRL